MQKFDNHQADNRCNSKKMSGLSDLEELYEVDFDDKSYNSKMKVECICPKCGERHMLAFHWIGRGTPRKYCQTCRGGSGG
jgi:ribosomal protein S27AE